MAKRRSFVDFQQILTRFFSIEPAPPKKAQLGTGKKLFALKVDYDETANSINLTRQST
ncbi:hypothetical protein WNY59_02305 [Ahrensia kielensis]|uniref:Uncharacterized protein n=1 Tax=Ahrensia kielensis TaxID=76980 RepID=A0ABU9T2R6_9HYPH